MTALQNNKKRLSTAKQHFLQAVREGMDVLMKEGGYGRERATQTLLHELGKTTESPTDNEIFHLMQLQGLGMEDATQALIVSKAVRQLLVRMSAVQAMEHLTAQLGRTHLLASTPPPLSPLSRKHTTSIHMTTTKPTLTKRKRTISNTLTREELPQLSSNRPRADSVSEEVTAKLADHKTTSNKKRGLETPVSSVKRAREA